MRIAIVSSDKIKVDERFGEAERFLIYEKKDDGLHFVDERVSEPMVIDYFDSEMCDWVADIIQDCQKVYTARICSEVKRAIADRGIIPVVYQGPIDQIHF
jgi:hypothetical protein